MTTFAETFSFETFFHLTFSDKVELQMKCNILKSRGSIMAKIPASFLLLFLCTIQAWDSGNSSADNETVTLLAQDIVESNLMSTNGNSFELCLYARKVHLCDPDKLLSYEEREQIDSELKTIEAITRQNDSRNQCRKQGMIIKLLLLNRYQDSIKTLIGKQSLAERWDFAYKCARMQFVYYTATDKVFGYIGSFFMLRNWLRLRGVEKENIYNGLETILPEIKSTLTSQIGFLNDSNGISSPLHWDFWLCGLQLPGYVCNPDGVLTENEQKHLDLELNYLKQHTVFRDSNEPCMRMGVYGLVVAVEREISWDTATNLIAAWNLDSQCQQSFVVVYSPASARFAFSIMRNFPIDPQYTKNMITQQYEINGGDNVNGLMSLISGIRHRVIENLSKKLSSEKSALTWQRKFDYIYIIIVVIGLLGNILCIATLLFCKSLSKNLVNKYLIVLLLSDTMFNLWILAVYLDLKIITWKFWTCVLANHIYHGAVCASSNVIVLLTMERFFAIVFPLHHMQYHHINRLKLVLTFLLPMQLWTIYFDLLPYTDPGDLTSATMLRRYFKNDVCEYRALLSLAMVYIPFYISILILPLFSAIFVNIIILIKLRRRSILQNNSTPVATSENPAKSDDSHRILWILPLIYILLTTPNVVTQIVGEVRSSWETYTGDIHPYATNIVDSIFYNIFLLHFVFNWFFYAMASSTFRKAFIHFWSQKLKRIPFFPTYAVAKKNNNSISVTANAGKLDSGTSRETQETDL